MTIKGELLAVQEGTYTTYVFSNLDESIDSWYKYIMVTRCPNWQQIGTMKIGDVGFLEYEIANAGDTYYNRNLESTCVYNYSGNYFINFIKKDEDNVFKEFKF